MPNDVLLPLSFAQQRLWFLDQLAPGGTEYLIPVVLRLTGELDVPALSAAVADLVARHESLRTVFGERGGRPGQRVLDPGPEVLRVAAAPAGPGEAAATATAPMDLQRGPLFRAVLYPQGPAEHLLALTFHHIVADGWSIGIVVDELSALYAAHLEGRKPELPEPPIQYPDFAIWQQETLDGPVLAEQLAYWTGKLADPTPLELPVDRPRPAVWSARGATLSFRIPADLAERLKEVFRAHRVTPFMGLLAAFQVLLARYSGRDDIAVGTPVAGRNRAETEGLIGFFVNTLVLRADLAGDPSFADLLAQVRETALAAYDHQDLPFERLVEHLAPDRDLSRTPLFQTMFNMQDPQAAGHAWALPGIEVTAEPLDWDVAKFDLSLELAETAAGFSGTLEYATDLFDRSTAERIAGHYLTLLAGVAADPATAVSRLPLLTEAEEQRLLADGSGRAARFPATRVHELVARQAAETPQRTAVVCGERALTYRELDERAERLAHRLRRAGVGPETLVGLCLDRSPDLVVALLGVLKSGGAYVPLDPAHPRERLARLLADIAAPVVVTERHLAERIPEAQGRTVLLLEDALNADAADTEGAPDTPAAADTPVLAPAPGATPGDLAYVVYTSGSTGTPKGVQTRHDNLVNGLLAMQDVLRLGPEDRLLAVAPYTFDMSSVDLLLPLLQGAQVHLATREQTTAPARLAALLADSGITVLQATPPLWRLVVEELPDLSDRLHVLLGGEALDPPLAAATRPKVRRLTHLYGPTETTIWTLGADVGADCAAQPAIPIGRPIANTRVYVLDAGLAPVPVGVPGELYIAGAGLARGFLNRPALTAERFPACPYGPPGERMYRTGDLVRWRADGDLEFLGRSDNQVKIRGFRIEPAEVEAALRAGGLVGDAVVIAREDVPGDRRLVAYVTPAAPGAEVDPAALRRRAGERLPDYMLPSHTVVIDAVPLTANGKVDRRALPAPDVARPRTGQAYVAPANPVEQSIARVWEQVLGVERVGAEDNFFELGGHSLLATQAVSQLRQEFGDGLGVQSVFAAPTVAGLAEIVSASGEPGPDAEPVLGMPPIRRVLRNGPLRASFAQERLWLLDQLVPDSAEYVILRVLRLTGDLDRDALERALTELVARHEVLRTRFEAEDGVPVQVIEPPAPLALPVTDLSALPAERAEAETAALVAAETGRPFDLGVAPLLRARLLRLCAEEHVLVLAVHHIAADAWGMGVLNRELAALYRAFRHGLPSPLEPLPIQYADFAVRQRYWLRGEILDGQLDYWRERLSDLTPLELPTDRPRPAVRSGRGAGHEFSLPAELSDELRALSHREGTTMFMTLLAAFQTLLAGYSGQEDIAVGTPIANRNRADTEGMVGFFVNTLVLRADLAGDPSFTGLLAQVRESAIGAYAHQDLPFERLVEELRPERDLARNPLFQVLFMFQNAPRTPLVLDGLTVTPGYWEQKVAKFDLTLSVNDSDGQLDCLIEYSTDLFDAGTVARMAGHFATLLAGIAAAPQSRLSELPVLTGPERRQLLEEWTDTAAPYPHDRCVHQLFEEQAARTPEAVALIAGTAEGATVEGAATERSATELTYGELNRRANRLAHHLIRSGAGPETLVGVCLERGPDLAVALLGILKSGAAYVPLDPVHPRERLAALLAGTGAALLVTRQSLLERLGVDTKGVCTEGVCTDVICLDRDAAAIAAHPDQDPAPTAGPGNLAYVVHTSGSTGTPKGVAAEHRGVSAYLSFVTSRYGITPGTRVLQLASIGFDASVRDLLGPLSCGATAVLAPLDGPFDPAAIAECIERHRVEVLLSTVPSQLRELLALPGAEHALASLRLTVASGESLRLAGQHGRRTLPGALVNQYGPTECTMTSTYWPATEDWADRTEDLVGRPIANKRVHLLDRHLNPVPVGVPGEVYIAGTGLARGYLGRPDLTAERFLACPYGPPGERMYRTGDLARWRADGDLEFLGRSDDQVKIRGVRVEPGEAEAALRADPTVGDVVVLAREDVPGQRRLVAYVTPAEPGRPVDPAALRHRAGERLPEYLVPVVVAIDALPLTVNGKVDRQALPAPDGTRPDTGRAYVAPVGPVQQTLARIWEQILNVGRVGAEDNFYELGGDSVLSIRAVHRAGRLGIHLTPRMMVRHQTIARIAAHLGRDGLDGAAAATGHATLTPLNNSAAEQEVFCFPVIAGNVTGYVPLARALSADARLLGVELSWWDRPDAAQWSIPTMARSCRDAILAGRPHGPYLLVGWSFGGVLALETARLLRAEGHPVRVVALDGILPTEEYREGVHGNIATIDALLARLAEGHAPDALPEDVAAGLEQLNIPPELHEVAGADLVRHLTVMRGIGTAVLAYRPAPVEFPVTLYEAAHRALPDWIGSTIRETWQPYVPDLEVRGTPGDHYSFLRYPIVRSLADGLRETVREHG
ncbi:amino acid adenylation domain-containing protein [Streptomyces sp. 1114.5]|uniref:non-ribosomal peptide synthetase n=1 Tax=Streptomyces sp. 1114.5 TaxID=1938830 RepID=UPI000EAB82EE|nr:non-ribosomal peptide synthetase [Streptomyces sp. 1114.5]RKT12301.1 amino acid adenylation domain-containing protein [Streptomyces sp. 1114.5]